ncbi:GNAT family N-acetyltransferase [Mangrovihabitans endophyticus]|uniref:GNAT family N-acetyltransferase n=1 Tax=Mangrovihabitans endophyticus TaxID=1751298 RepID=UPI001E313801|nr:GNAT family N-acetyltransferase [Mangrovihabitans endophyticus]
MDVKIRRAQPHDLDRLSATLDRDDHAYYLDCMAYQDTDSGEVVVAVVGDEPVGALFARWSDADEPEVIEHLPKVPMLYRVVVRADVRGRKVGTTMVLATMDRLRERGYDRVALGVDQSNAGARRLYERLGFVVSDAPGLRGLRTALRPHENGVRTAPYDILVARLDAPFVARPDGPGDAP